MLPDPKTYLPEWLYNLMWRTSYFIAGLVFNHPTPISLCAYYYYRDWKGVVRVVDFFLGERHCQLAWRRYLVSGNRLDREKVNK